MGTEEPKDEGKEEKTFEVASAAGLMMAALDANDSGIFAFAPEYWKVYRGQTQGEVGDILGAVSVGMLLGAPVVFYLMPKVGGPHMIYWYGLLAYLASRILILLLVLIPASAPTAYFYASIGAFGLTGMVYSFTEIGCATWVLTSCKKEERIMAGATLMEGRGLGSILGPALGGGLYSFGFRYSADVGFNLPLAVLALIMLGLVFMNKKLVHSQDYSATMSEGFTGFKSGVIFRSIPCTLVFIGALLTISLVFFCSPIQQPMFVEDYGFTNWEYGIVYSILAFGFVIGTSVAPGVEKYVGMLGALCLGCFGQGFFTMWFGPSPLLSFLPAASASTAWVPVTAAMMSFVFLGLQIVIQNPLMIGYAESIGISSADATTQVVTFQVLNMAAGFGCAPIAGNIAQSVGYAWAFTYGGLNYIVASLILCFLCKVFSKPAQARTQSVNRVALLHTPVV